MYTSTFSGTWRKIDDLHIIYLPLIFKYVHQSYLSTQPLLLQGCKPSFFGIYIIVQCIHWWSTLTIASIHILRYSDEFSRNACPVLRIATLSPISYPIPDPTGTSFRNLPGGSNRRTVFTIEVAMYLFSNLCVVGLRYSAWWHRQVTGSGHSQDVYSLHRLDQIRHH